MSQPTPPSPGGPRADAPISLNGQVLPRPRTPAVGGGSFSIDLDRAREAIRELRAASHELRQIHQQAVALGKVDPTSHDSVSADVAMLLGAAAVGGPGSLIAALEAGIEQIDALATAMEDELAAYGAVERTNADRAARADPR